MEDIFHKIILNIYFDNIHHMCLYRVFSVHCTGYMLVGNNASSSYSLLLSNFLLCFSVCLSNWHALDDLGSARYLEYCERCIWYVHVISTTLAFIIVLELKNRTGYYRSAIHACGKRKLHLSQSSLALQINDLVVLRMFLSQSSLAL